MLTRSLLLVALLSLSACGPADTHDEPCSSSSSSTGTAPPYECPPPEDRAPAGVACTQDCDCCGNNCGDWTRVDGGMHKTCILPCPAASP